MEIWTIEKIDKLPEFGSDNGWFYGLVRGEDGSLCLAEILPGLGYAKMNQRKDFDPRLMNYKWVIRDIFYKLAS